ncbi:NAD(P)/FAD-dependent oxidoreductase [Pseudoxanthomonas beigongshangi]
MSSVSWRPRPRVVDAAVIGCGIVGLSTAFQLQRRGLSCLLIDPRGPAGDASHGNAGAVSVGNLMPASDPAMAWPALRGLRDPLAPFKLDAGAWPHYAAWLWRFLRAGQPPRIAAIVDATHALNHAARAAWLDLAGAIGALDLISPTGYLHVYSQDASFERAAIARTQMQRHGVAFDVLDGAQLRELEPGLAPFARHGVLQRDSLFVQEPGEFCRRLFNWLCARGTDTLIASARVIEREGEGYRVGTSGGDVHADQVVVAAGAWSGELLRSFGLRLPVAAARGYHAMYPRQEGVVRRPTLWAERYMVVSPMRSGVRVTGFKEMTAPGRPARPGLIRGLAPQARQLFPALAGEPVSDWAGLRPCTPDSLPILDRVEGERIFIATGHGHLGLTQGPISGELTARSMMGEGSPVPLAPYRLARFGGAARA